MSISTQAKHFKGFDKALKDFPGRDSIKIGAAEAQELFGYSDLILGKLSCTIRHTSVVLYQPYKLIIMKFKNLSS